MGLPRSGFRPTALALSCAAEARVPKSHGMLVAAYTAGQRHAICNQHDAATLVFGPGGSAAGPKPGRIGFSDKLGSRARRLRFRTVLG